MTALATIFALFPMALGLTGDSGFISKPLAIVVIGGLFSSTILTLVLVPVLYWLVEGRAERKALRLERKQARLDKKETKKAARIDAKQQKLAAKSGVPAAVAIATETTEAPKLAEPRPSEPPTPVVEEPVVVAAPELTPVVGETKPEVVNWEEAIAEEIAQEASLAVEPEFTPAPESEAPSLAWSIDESNVELDNDSQMNWNEAKTETAPIPAVREELPKFVTEAPAAPTKAELKQAKKQAKLDLKAQKKAAKESRHSND
jgi:HAE1 family hydrophobic/amphiphilic exporter-1